MSEFYSKLYDRRLRDWEAFDRITLELVPRYKESELSGDEWRTSVSVTYWFKGHVVHEERYTDMQAAIMCLGKDWLRAQEPIPDEVIELEKQYCDQPSCCEAPTQHFRLKKVFSLQGEELSGELLKYKRKFCQRHSRRGDCSREDSDSNMELLAPEEGV